MNRPSMTMPDIGARIIADNRKNDHCTADPIFVVQEQKRIYGIDTEYDPPIEWQHGDEYTALDDEQAAIAEAFFQEHCEAPKFIVAGVAFGRRIDPEPARDEADYISDLRRVGYHEYWDFVQPFFTGESAEYYIETNSHRHRGKLRVYVDSAYRNWEWQAMRKMLAESVERSRVEASRTLGSGAEETAYC